MSKFAVFLADGFEEVEALTPVDYLRRAGVEVITVGIVGLPFNDTMIVTGSHNIKVIADMSFDTYLNTFGKDFPDGVFCPGGLKGANNLGNSETLLSHMEKCFEAGKIVSAICASPAVVLGKTKIPDGKKWTCYPGMAEESEAEYQKNYEDKAFVTDGNLVTGRAAGAAEEFAQELIRVLCGNETAKKVHDGTVQR